VLDAKTPSLRERDQWMKEWQRQIAAVTQARRRDRPGETKSRQVGSTELRTCTQAFAFLQFASALDRRTPGRHCFA